MAAIVLAAGLSRRMGERNKLLIPIDGRPMIVHVAEAASASRADPVIVVTGHDSAAIVAALAELDVNCVHAPDYEQGLSRSLARGLDAVPGWAEGVVVCLGDMPGIRASHIDRLIGAFAPDGHGAICVASHEGRRGNPALLARRFFADIRAVQGDTGARDLIARHDALVCEVAMAEPAPLIDVDSPEDIARLAEIRPPGASASGGRGRP